MTGDEDSSPLEDFTSPLSSSSSSPSILSSLSPTCCLIKSLGLILQPYPLLLLLMVLTHDVDYVNSKN